MASISIGSLLIFNELRGSANLYGGGEYPFQLRISSPKTEYKKSEYVVVSVSAENVGDFDVTLMGACSGYFDVIVDWESNILRDRDADRACTQAALPRLHPGARSEIATLELDLSRFNTGYHTITAVYDYEDPVGVQQARSNEIAIEILPGDNISEEGCSSFIAYTVSYCDQVMIRTSHNLTAQENNEICQNIYDKYIDRHHPSPQPIPSLSTMGCDEGEPAVFVFNVADDQAKFFEDRASEAKKIERICWSTRYSVEWINNPTFDNTRWNGCSY